MRRGRLGVVLLALVAAGCSRGPAPRAPVETPEESLLPTVLQPAETSVDSGPYLSPLPTIAPLPQPVAKQVAGFEWTENPDPGGIPDSGVTGRLHGRDFVCLHASVTTEREASLPTWRIRLSNKPRGDLCGYALDDDAVTIEWHKPVGVGTWSRSMSQARPAGSDAWFVIEQSDSSPYTRSVEWAAHVTIEEVRGSTEDGGASSLLGRLAVCFGDEDKSWVAGKFAADGCAR